jgi:DNA-binding transcriptional MerR regulator
MPPVPLLSIGELARRTGLSVSAIRFYEARGLVTAVLTAGNQRRFLRADLRRVSFALIAQQLGLSLGEIAAELATLPQGRAPTRADWQAISRRIRGAPCRTASPCSSARATGWMAASAAAASRSPAVPSTIPATAPPRPGRGRDIW